MTTTEAATNAPSPKFMKPKPYRRQELDDDNALPQVAVKDKTKFTAADVEKIVEETTNKVQETALNPEEQTWKKRYGDLRAHQQRQEKEFNKQLAELKASIAAAQVPANKEMPKSKDEVQAWANQYPDVYALVRSVAAQEQESQINALQAQVDQLMTNLHMESADKAKAILKSLHPDVDELGDDPAFHDWAKALPKNFRDALYEDNDPHAAAKVITMYKAEMGLLNNDKQPAKKPAKPNLEASKAVTNSKAADISVDGDKSVIKESWIHSLKGKEFEKYEDMIDQARNEGRVIYDISGSR